jgi:hypothetical protein
MNRIVGRDLSGMLNSLFGGKKDRSKKKKKQIEEATPASPDAGNAMPALPSPSASPEEALPQPTPTPILSP